ncbi:hypothetical protein JX265_013117 [Neoarthrinium moseri]|uniref:Cytochrome P450 n=1 Tax=Neoarthrinium moseri TaxID=1658444 RepID=A0A9Q0AI15_9PEZI|nr:hypothetical protein JX265_013117 [Neoarthrinium moseri]
MYYIDGLHKVYGPIVRIAPHEVAIADLEAFSEIHRIGGGFLKSAWYDNAAVGNEPGIFSMRNPKEHAQRRRMFARGFSKSGLRSNWEDIVRDTVEEAVARIKAEATHGTTDALKWWTLMAADVVSQLAFGHSFEMVRRGEKSDFNKALEKTLMSGAMQRELPLVFAIMRFIPLESVQRIVTAEDVLYEHGTKAVMKFREGGGHLNLFSQMISESESNEKSTLSDQTVWREASNLIFAGSDTTATTMTYLTWVVLKMPSLRERLEEEVAALSPGFRDQDLEELPLLNAVIDEVLRLYGAAPGSLPRNVPEGGATLGGYFLPAGTVVSTQAFTFHRDSAIFPDPLKFDESRFLKPQTPAQKVAFHPFGAGARSCQGFHLARMELRYAAAYFFRECRDARLGDNMSDSMMEMESFFLIAPKAHRCDVTIAPRP